ncbi:GNAT family N-acetyltransferase [Patescibacteria group bacterium]
METKIVQAKENDLGEILEINVVLWLNIPDFFWLDPGWTEEQIRKGNFFLLKYKGKNVGALCLKISKSAIGVETIAIRKRYQNMGFGTKLINFAKRRARKNGKSQHTVTSFVEYGLKEFYQNQGFELLERKGIYHGHKYHRFVMDLE